MCVCFFSFNKCYLIKIEFAFSMKKERSSSVRLIFLDNLVISDDEFVMLDEMEGLKNTFISFYIYINTRCEHYL